MHDTEKLNEQEMESLVIMARELAELIRNHEITQAYEESLKQVRKDITALEIISQLIRMGEDLQDKANRGEPLFIDQAAEKELLRQRMENNPLVKNHLLAQKRYLNLMNMVMERVKNPLSSDLAMDI